MHLVTYTAVLFSVMLTQHMMMIVVVAAIVEWLLGALWYGLIFRKSWMAMAGFSDTNKPKNGALGMVSSLIACLLLTYVIAHVVSWAGAMTFTGGAKLGVICWLGFMAPPLFTQHIFENRRANLFAINAAYWLLVMAIAGGMTAAFHG
ncbi:MAG TPA: DUF1761 domain-containing protein [Terracidiphilus sp.]|nr:DUF1761 domain-containing protein [Terracidiphilus sp.]